MPIDRLSTVSVDHGFVQTATVPHGPAGGEVTESPPESEKEKPGAVEAAWRAVALEAIAAEHADATPRVVGGAPGDDEVIDV